MKQRTLAMMTGFEQYARKTRRAIFLEEMEQVRRVSTTLRHMIPEFTEV